MLQIWTPLPNGAGCIVASLYWRSASIPIPNDSADFFHSLWRQQFTAFCLFVRTYWFCFTGAETEIHKIKDDSKIKRQTNLDRRGPSLIGTDWHISDPPTFSLPTTFKNIIKVHERCQILEWRRICLLELITWLHGDGWLRREMGG